jgi:hypothetical protein
LNLRALRQLRGMERFFAFLVPIAIPVAIFHFVSGRYGNGIMATGAILLGSAVLVISIRTGGATEEQVIDQPDDDDDWFGWLEDDDPADELDRPTNEPLPAPFQAVLDEIWSKRIPGSGDDDSHIRQPR